MNRIKKGCCVTSKARGHAASNLLFMWWCYHAVRKPKLPTCLVVDVGCWLGSKGKHPPQKKSQSETVLSFALEVTRVISVPCLNSWPTEPVSMINGCFILLSFGVIYSAIVTETASKYPFKWTWILGRNKIFLYPRHSRKSYWRLLFWSLLNSRQHFYTLLYTSQTSA